MNRQLQTKCQHRQAVFILHRDLRWQDNVGLNALIRSHSNFALLFIFTKEQINNNSWFCQQSFNFLMQRLSVLHDKHQINFLIADSESSGIEDIIIRNQICCVFTNDDFTPYAQERSRQTKLMLEKYQVKYRVFQDYLLFPPGRIVASGKVLSQTFTSFWNKVLAYQAEILVPHVLSSNLLQFQLLQGCVPWEALGLTWSQVSPLTKRKNVFTAILNVSLDYHQLRNFLDQTASSQVSAAIKYGVISIREALQAMRSRFGQLNNPLVRQLFWREFFYHAAILGQKHNLWAWGKNWNPKYDHIKWCSDRKLFHKWCQGETGYPLVDAAMHELNTTGFMHNRARLVTASFLTKNLFFHWSWGEKYFAQHLIDYDPIVNQMSWQWVAGCGLDRAPYFRIFNPVIQQKKFDPHKIYLKRFGYNRNLEPIVDWSTSRQEYLVKIKEHLLSCGHDYKKV